MARPAYSTPSSALREIAALRKEARLCRRLCRQAAACLRLHEERACMIRLAERYEARAAALEANVQEEMLQTPDVAGATVAWWEEVFPWPAAATMERAT